MDDLGGDHRWLSYAELAEARGISRASAIRLVRKHRWRRQKNNTGMVTVAVPVAFTVAEKRGASDGPGDRPDGALGILAAALEVLKGELALAHARADRAEAKLAQVRAGSRLARTWRMFRGRA